ncbi:MAG: ATP-binding protein [Deltaproteobacteria bacterium]|nr:ATP-binding protein [Deltaproteobacteria bacterium]
MRKRFEALPISKKTFLIGFISLTLALFFFSIVTFFLEIAELKNLYVSQLSSISEVLGKNLASALATENREIANSVLNSLKEMNRIEQAILFDETKRVFSYYKACNSPFEIPERLDRCEKARFPMRKLQVCTAILGPDEKKYVGYLLLTADITGFYRRIGTYAFVLVTFLGLTYILASSILRKITGSVYEPLREFVNFIRGITQSRDYTRRFKLDNRDEIGFLADAFNEMLDIVEKHKAELEKHQKYLESLIQERTRELNITYEKLEKELKEKIRAQDALIESKMRYETVFEACPSALIITDPNGVIEEVNNAFLFMTGYEREEIVGRNVIDFIAEDKKEVVRSMLKVDSSDWKGEKIQDTEIGIVTKTGEKRKAIFTVTPMPKMGDLLFSITDVTELKRLEEELVQAQKLDAIGKLAGGVAHDFNNLLTVILGYCSLIKNSQVPDKIRKFLESIESAANRGKDLTSGLLAFSRRQPSQPKPLNVNEIILEFAKMVKRLTPPNITLEIELVSTDPIVLADESQVNQVLLNLVTNAIDAMPDGGRLKIKTEIVSLDKRLRKLREPAQEGQYVVITVSDTGVGIEEEFLDRIFEPFFTTKPKGKGIGLGLSIVYGIVSQNNGFIDVKSKKGEGTQFSIYFPLLSQEKIEPIKPEKEPSQDLKKGSGELILVAEDDENVRSFLKLLLEDFGYRVLEAKDGKDALEKFLAQKDEIALAILDVVMPRMTGREVYEAIRNTLPSLPVVLMSGYAYDHITKEVPLDVPLVQKPISVENLLFVVESSLKKRNLG